MADDSKPKHAGDCTIYSSLCNQRPTDGICTCGYALRKQREVGEEDDFYSEERKATMPQLSPEEQKAAEDLLNKLFPPTE